MASTTPSPNRNQDWGKCFGIEAWRVLKPGGRLAISDVVATAELPPEWRDDPALHSGCMAGAVRIEALEAMLRAAGFIAIAIQPKDQSREFIRDWAPDRGVENYLVAATIATLKPDPSHLPQRASWP